MISPKSKRLRVFAGPNGSGKTTLAKKLSSEGKFHLKIFVNADEIEKEIKEKGCLILGKFRLGGAKTEDFVLYVEAHGMSVHRLKGFKASKLYVENNRLYYDGEINSYIASDIASFIRNRLLDLGESFAFETVFSHESKLEFMQVAKAMGYKVYFYFLAIDDPEININRVNLRVEKNGHPVNPEKIVSRYYRSLAQLYDAVKISYRAFLFDNTGLLFELVAKVDFGKKVEVLDFDKQIPNWFVEYFYKKT